MKHDIHVAVLIVGCGRLEVRLSHGATARKAARRTGRPDASSVALERAVAVWFRPATRRTRPRRKRRCGVHLTPRLAPAKGRWQAPTQVRPSSRSVRDEATLFVLRGTGIQSGRCSAINVDALRAIKRGYQRLQRRSDINTPPSDLRFSTSMLTFVFALGLAFEFMRLSPPRLVSQVLA